VLEGSITPDTSKSLGSIQVPLSRENFRRYHDHLIGTLRAGFWIAFFGLCCIGFGVYVALPTAGLEAGWVLALLGLVLDTIVIGAVVPGLRLSAAQTTILDQRLPALIVDEEGITDNCSSYLLGMIPWSNIADIKLAQQKSSRKSFTPHKIWVGVAIVVKNKDALLIDLPLWKRMWMSLDDTVNFGRRIFVSQGRIDAPIAEFVEQVKQFREIRGC
jgi:hypothetical protein